MNFELMQLAERNREKRERDMRDEALQDQYNVELIWEVLFDLPPKDQREIVYVLFREIGNGQGDFTECGRLLHKPSHERVEMILSDAIASGKYIREET